MKLWKELYEIRLEEKGGFLEGLILTKETAAHGPW